MFFPVRSGCQDGCQGILQRGELRDQRSPDWLSQAEHDLQHARNSLKDGDYDWACFAAHQAAEKAVRALFQCKGGEGWGHSITGFWRSGPTSFGFPKAYLRPPSDWISITFPPGIRTGSTAVPPRDYYAHEDAERAIVDAEAVYGFCRQSFCE